LRTLFQKAQAIKTTSTKFSPAAMKGTGILPSKTKDAGLQRGLDAGHYDESTKNLSAMLQVNSQVKKPALKEWIKNSTHGKLATASSDTNAKDPKWNMQGSQGAGRSASQLL
jgi:hypothetical protein